jgi:hypothetical protein
MTLHGGGSQEAAGAGLTNINAMRPVFDRMRGG